MKREGGRVRTTLLLLAVVLCSCSDTSKSARTATPRSAHAIVSDGAPVPGAPEPEVVQLRKTEMLDRMKHVTVGNDAGDYVLVCSPAANEDQGVQSCLSPRPQRDYLLFRENTKWLIRGAKEPMTLKFMQDFSVIYNGKENVGLLPAQNLTKDESFGMYWLSSWTASSPGR